VNDAATITAEPLNEGGFAPFGELITATEHPGRRRTDAAVDFADGRRLVLSTTHVAPSELPIRVTELERHPFSSQTFVPLSVERWLLIVSTSLDVTDVRAFVAGPGIGVTIGRGVWHHGLTVLDGPGRFAVLMGKDGATDDERAAVPPFTVRVTQS